MSTLKTAQPWEALSVESARMYEAFRSYISLGPNRTLKQAAEKQNAPLSTTKGRAKRYNWIARAKAWDAHLARCEQKARESEATKAGRRAERIAQRMATAALEETTKFVTASKSTDEMVPIPRDLVKLGAEAFKVSRLIAGKATEQIEPEEKHDLSMLTVDDLREMERLDRKMRGLDPEPEPEQTAGYKLSDCFPSSKAVAARGFEAE